MKLRWLTVENPVNADEVRLFAATNQLAMMDAKNRLQDKKGPFLQYWDGHLEEWITVPHVSEFRK